jgi:hypothetical protein
LKHVKSSRIGDDEILGDLKDLLAKVGRSWVMNYDRFYDSMSSFCATIAAEA